MHVRMDVAKAGICDDVPMTERVCKNTFSYTYAMHVRLDVAKEDQIMRCNMLMGGGGGGRTFFRSVPN
jgi:hypothetical protein